LNDTVDEVLAGALGLAAVWDFLLLPQAVTATSEAARAHAVTTVAGWLFGRTRNRNRMSFLS
jgi:hypothetical protein